MAGYSGKPLVEKLGIKSGQHVALLHAPRDFSALLAPLPVDVMLHSTLDATAAVVLLFATDSATLASELPAAARALPASGMLWVAWPKKAAKQGTDLNENEVRRIGLSTGLVDVKVCAVDEVWAGLKFVHRRASRG